MVRVWWEIEVSLAVKGAQPQAIEADDNRLPYLWDFGNSLEPVAVSKGEDCCQSMLRITPVTTGLQIKAPGGSTFDDLCIQALVVLRKIP